MYNDLRLWAYSLSLEDINCYSGDQFNPKLSIWIQICAFKIAFGVDIGGLIFLVYERTLSSKRTVSSVIIWVPVWLAHILFSTDSKHRGEASRSLGGILSAHTLSVGSKRSRTHQGTCASHRALLLLCLVLPLVWQPWHQNYYLTPNITSGEPIWCWRHCLKYYSLHPSSEPWSDMVG